MKKNKTPLLLKSITSKAISVDNGNFKSKKYQTNEHFAREIYFTFRYFNS
jgi:hypothetical protein